mmetsp:Transcript_15585/g.28326  ORF Transcript_15585/g.28326 Transcript_15585/m.28326 type:complete len:92 (+) Transcript_15585:99-374(+)
MRLTASVNGAAKDLLLNSGKQCCDSNGPCIMHYALLTDANMSRLDERLRSIKPEFDLRGASSLADDDTDILGMDDSSCHSRRNVHFASSVR